MTYVTELVDEAIEALEGHDVVMAGDVRDRLEEIREVLAEEDA